MDIYLSSALNSLTERQIHALVVFVSVSISTLYFFFLQPRSKKNKTKITEIECRWRWAQDGRFLKLCRQMAVVVFFF